MYRKCFGVYFCEHEATVLQLVTFCMEMLGEESVFLENQWLCSHSGQIGSQSYGFCDA